ncbi:hypothetical protein MICA_7 [Micavibrio aeruginosavorus ARL-13]|uniref:Uncharacterized protein n=1 Tax=Micavibrio aeruginosavorus (strain ARL-13) TaxID=856793 RepID=G2KLB9_MICAA|nr:hypothetical protein MICA_7 [Micavibrio aeruginosavorus ARL-13]
MRPGARTYRTAQNTRTKKRPEYAGAFSQLVCMKKFLLVHRLEEIVV